VPAPPSVVEATRVAEAMNPGRMSKRAAIAVRRFAGPLAHVERIGHLRVAHLTDLHFGRVTPVEVQRRAIDLTNEQKPDLVAITGDFVCHSQLYLDQLEDVLSRLDAPAIGVLGNHDHWSGSDEVRAALRRAGVEVLDNAHTIHTIRHERLQLVGLDDAYTGHADRRRAVKGLRHDLPTLGLSHIAEEADGLWQSGVPLVLSGHTHAGQVTVARLHELAIGRFGGHRYVHGLYGTRRSRDTSSGAVYVGAGIGAAVLPLRIGERGQREVAVFELGHAPGAFDEHHDDQKPLKGRKPSGWTLYKRAIAVEKKRTKRDRKKPNGR
jgi:predicted MPP superfamily phosphohydrolase